MRNEQLAWETFLSRELENQKRTVKILIFPRIEIIRQ